MIDLDATLQTAINAGQVNQFCELLRIDPPNAAVERRTNYHSAVIALEETWDADGLWLGISNITADARNVDVVWTVALDLRNTAILNRNYDGASIWYYLAFLGNDGLVIGDPVLMAHGVDVAPGNDDESEAAITRVLEVHSYLWADQLEATQHARTDIAQRTRHSGDRIFKDTALLKRTQFIVGGTGVFEFR